jgi:repressor LexA
MPKKKTEPDARDRKALAYILDRLRRHRRAPSYAEVGKHLGLKSPNNAGRICKWLVDAGLLKADYVVAGEPGRPRALAGVAPAPGAGGTSCRLEVLGLVAAGKPVAPPEPPGLGFFNFAEAFGREGNQMLEVRGGSMVGIGILDGDHIVVEPADTAEPGDVVVARVNGCYTLKVFRRRRGRVFLDACNDEVAPIEVVPADEAQVVGVYAGLVRTKKRRRGR